MIGGIYLRAYITINYVVENKNIRKCWQQMLMTNGYEKC